MSSTREPLNAFDAMIRGWIRTGQERETPLVALSYGELLGPEVLRTPSMSSNPHSLACR